MAQRGSKGGAVRRTVTLSAKTDEAVSFLIGEDGNYSEFVDEALRAHAQHARIDAWLAEYERKHGPIPKEVEVWAEQQVQRWLKNRKSHATAARSSRSRAVK